MALVQPPQPGDLAPWLMWRDFVTKTANYQLVYNDNGKFFDDLGASGNVVLTLPAIAPNYAFAFLNASGHTLTVTSKEGGNVIVPGNASASSCALSAVGSWCKVQSNSRGTKWQCLQSTSGGAPGTVTSVATGNGLTGGPITTTGTISWLGLPVVTPTVTANVCTVQPWKTNLLTNSGTNFVANLPAASTPVTLAVGITDATAIATLTPGAGDNIFGLSTLPIAQSLYHYTVLTLVSDGVHTWQATAFSQNLAFPLQGAQPTPAITGNTPQTLAAAVMDGGYIVDVRLTATLAGPGTLTLDTTANILSDFQNNVLGQSLGGTGFFWTMRINNESAGPFAWTLAPGDGNTTITGAATIPQGTWREFVVALNTSGGVTVPGKIEVYGLNTVGPTAFPLPLAQVGISSGALATAFTDATGTLANTNLSFALLANHSYEIEGLFRVSNTTAADGAQFSFNGGTVAASIFFASAAASGTVVAGTESSTALNGVINYTTVTGTAYIAIKGFLITTGAAGTLILQAATNTAVSGTMSLLTGSWLRLTGTPLL